MDRMLRYSMQLAMLKKLKKQELITEREYLQIKQQLMKDYGVINNIIIKE